MSLLALERVVGNSLWRGGIKWGLAVPAACAGFVHAVKFRPRAVLQGPSSWGWPLRDALVGSHCDVRFSRWESHGTG